MGAIRIIPRLDVKGPNLVKGIHLEGLRVLGKPQDFAKFYYKHGADELLFMDVVASLYERNSLHDIITETAKDVFIPMTVGGGLRTIEDIKAVLRAGADKVCLNTAAIKDPALISRAAHIFGSSTIVVAIEAIRDKEGNYFAYTDNGREYTGIEVVQWAKKVCELGAGEIIITSVDREGTGEGFDIGLISLVADAVNIPVVAHGGAGKISDVVELIQKTGIEAVSIASLFHYHFLQENISAGDANEGNTEFLKRKLSQRMIAAASIAAVKSELMEHQIECRL